MKSPPGVPWNDEIQEHLAETDLFLPLVSKNFFISDFIQDEEIPYAERRRLEGSAYVIPVLLNHCSWEDDPIISHLEVVPKGKPISSKDWESPDFAWTHVVGKISARAKQILADPAFVARREAEAERVRREEERKRLAALAAEALAKKEQAEKDRLAREKAAAEQAQQNRRPGQNRKSGFELIEVPGGTFTMGSNDYDSEKPPHSVTVPTFSIGKYPVTQADWREIMGSDPPELYFKNQDQCPVERVSWNDVQEFLKTLNTKFPGKNYRLLTEAEWEFAARGGTKSKGFKFAGSNELKEVGWFRENSDSKTHPVGEKKENELALHDMSGNVWEWCQDEWHENYQGAPTDGKAWGSGDAGLAVLRGGSWGNDDNDCRSANRDRDLPTNRVYNNGFRLARVS